MFRSLAMDSLLVLILVLLLSPHRACAQTSLSSTPTKGKLGSVIVNGGKFDRKNCVVQTAIELSDESLSSVILVGPNGKRIFGQLTESTVLQPMESKQKQLTFIAPSLPRGEYQRFDVYPAERSKKLAFEWHDDASTQAELHRNGKAVIRYMYEAVDDASETRRQETYKTYHHVFSPDGSQLLTKGPGGLYPHHRGIYFGFNRISYDGNKADTWHCPDGESQRQALDPIHFSGNVFGRDLNSISWHGKDGVAFADETRQLTVYKIGEGTLIQFDSLLKTRGPKVTLDGDPQHAGVQFRASQRVAEESKTKTFYIRPDGAGRLNAFRNWSNKPNETDLNKNHINLPFNAMCFTIGEKTYTCCYIDHPENPKPARFSERDYGRFGSYFRYEITEDAPLKVKYRFWIQEGEMSVDLCRSLARNFRNPVDIKTKVPDAKR